ncbi:GTP pyrophosphokinase [Stenotrophomonas maltophilia]|uniref:GTP pyrophosphokinase n=1 Tax=Stenotrophomonas maltophilia TaxID=40324 RepID=UPI003D7D2238
MNIDDWVIAFEARRPNQARFTEKLESLVRDLMVAGNLGFHLAESRTKDVQSFRDKASRPTKAYENPLDEITDLSGIRIIAYYQDEADQIGSLIEEEFAVDARNSVIHKPDGAEFGYLSRHYVVQLSSKRAMLSEWSGFAELKAEIQVRTVLQHAWAAVSHKLQYKREDDVPVPLRRKLFRLSALFELADDEFISLRSSSGELARSIKTQLVAGRQDLPIDSVSLSEVLVFSTAVAEIEIVAKKVGFTYGNPDGDIEDEDEHSASVSGLVHLCALAGVRTIEEFESLLSTARPWMESYLSAQINAEGRWGEWFASTPFICQLLVIYAKIRQLRVEDIYSLGWNPGIAERIFRVARTWRTESPKV